MWLCETGVIEIVKYVVGDFIMRRMDSMRMIYCNWMTNEYIGGLVQERRNSVTYALELRISCTNASTYNFRQAEFHRQGPIIWYQSLPSGPCFACMVGGDWWWHCPLCGPLDDRRVSIKSKERLLLSRFIKGEVRFNTRVLLLKSVVLYQRMDK